MENKLQERGKFYKELLAGMKLLRIPATEYNLDKLQACEKFIAEHLAWVTPDMMREAFGLYVSGNMHMAEKDDHYGTISAEWVCRLLNIYRKHDKRTEYNYTPVENQIETNNEPEEIDLQASFERLHEHYRKTGKLTTPCVHLYDWAEREGIIRFSRVEKNAIFEKGKQRYVEYLSEVEQQGASEIKMVMSKMTLNTKLALKTQAKYVALMRYFDGLTEKAQ